MKREEHKIISCRHFIQEIRVEQKRGVPFDSFDVGVTRDNDVKKKNHRVDQIKSSIDDAQRQRKRNTALIVF